MRTQIVQRILHELGWDVFDPDKVCNEFPLKLKASTRRIDLALCVSGRNPRCIVELKATNYDLKQIGKSDGDQQLFEYAFYAGAPIALLTNGINWRFYSTFSAGTYEERLVRALDIQTQTVAEVAAALDRYLSYAHTESGRAAHYAKDDLDRRIGQVKARAAIPRAWADLVDADTDERLVTLVVTATSALADSEPARADVIDFLRRLRAEDSATPRKRKPSRDAEPRRRVSETGDSNSLNTNSPNMRPGRRPPSGSRTVRYLLFGESRSATNASRAFVDVIDAMATRDPGFLESLEPRMRGRRGQVIARTQGKLGAHEWVQQSAVQMASGWWVCPAMSNSAKIRRLRIACEVAGIPFGDPAGLEIDLPNA